MLSIQLSKYAFSVCIHCVLYRPHHSPGHSEVGQANATRITTCVEYHFTLCEKLIELLTTLRSRKVGHKGTLIPH